MRISIRWIAVMCTTVMCRSSIATVVDFEDLGDQMSVGSYYATEGLYFENAIALTAGFSLDEIDYPPHSGDIVVGENNAAIDIVFDKIVNSISAYFTYGDGLIITAYDALGNQIDSSYILTGNNLGSSSLVALSFNEVHRLGIAGNTPNTFIMDDLSFTPVSDAGGTFSILAGVCMVLLTMLRKR